MQSQEKHKGESMNLKTLKDCDLKGKKVLLRADLNVPMKDGKVDNDERIVRTLPTVKYMMEQGAKVTIATHLGRPKGDGFEKEFSLEPVAKYLEEKLGKRVNFVNDCIGEKVVNKVESIKDDEVLMLENLRFYKQETKNDADFVKELAKGYDVYVSDAFSTSHRAHASTEGVAHILDSYAGLLMEEEVTALSKITNNPERPSAAIVGGAKISTKLALLKNLVQKVDHLILCGGMGNTLLFALGTNVEGCLHEAEMKKEALEIIEEAKKHNCEIVLPVDGTGAKELKEGIETVNFTHSDDRTGYEIFDAGSQSVELFKETISSVKTILWNGPLGVFEVPPFNKATNELAKHVGDLTKQGKLTSVAGGGDTVSALQRSGASADFTYLSTAGGAFLEWIEGKELPGVKVLTK